MNVDELTLDQLRVAIAVQLGWTDIVAISAIEDLWGQGPGYSSGGIEAEPWGLPNWPNDINEAWKLESRLDRAGQNAYILELLKPGAVGGSGERRMFDFVHATAEERCRAWLKATVSE